MHVALQIVLAKWFSSGLPVHQVHKCTKYTSARAETGAKTGRANRGSKEACLGESRLHAGGIWTPRAARAGAHLGDLLVS